MVSADECGRSLRGMAALLNRRPDGVAAPVTPGDDFNPGNS